MTDQGEPRKSSRKLTKSEQWERAHPDDVPCPRGKDYPERRAARIWRMERGIILHPATRKRLERDRERYRAAMLNKDQH